MISKFIPLRDVHLKKLYIELRVSSPHGTNRIRKAQ